MTPHDNTTEPAETAPDDPVLNSDGTPDQDTTVITPGATAHPQDTGVISIEAPAPQETAVTSTAAPAHPQEAAVISTAATVPPSRSEETCSPPETPQLSPPNQRPRQLLAPGLYLVSTPIGNLEDISLRALRVLGEADRIACEDTRQTQKLLNHFGLRTPTVSYHQHNERERAAELLTALQSGARIAVVSDAGTPGLADPGAVLAELSAAAGIPVFPIPGASALLAAVTASGLPAESIRFHSFLPAKSGERRSALESLRRAHDLLTTAGLAPAPTIEAFYEAPHRILDTLADLEATFGPAQPIVLARELTKLHEEFLRGPVSTVRATLTARDTVRGEFVLLVPISSEPPADQPAPAETVAQAIRALIAAGTPEKDAMKQVARDRNLGKSDVYREWQRHRNR